MTKKKNQAKNRDAALRREWRACPYKMTFAAFKAQVRENERGR